ncbi:NAD kinase [Chitinimonas taiwanensis]|jgi:NAD+ kinase|uniref:NAD kinase n=1 Tax=Chitinimonas taiwanensis DSM 18899 TaxID=1121279 RepID=A0A1K2HM13_9NEIS|nr:NAD kinase [Chitinimonas taiwanensis]SFZ77864.1 NAD+ kinase [Chitinimonas taiwanensis DSM 18899]
MSMLFKKIALVARRNSPNIGAPLRRLAALLRQYECSSIVLDADTAAEHPIPDTLIVPPDQIGKVADLVIVLGGDGTMLSIARLVAPYRIPLVGINQGRLGFMTDIGVDDIEAIIPRILDGDFVPEERMLLSAKVIRGEREIHAALAVNDVVFSRGALGSMIEFEIFIDDQFVYSQRSDGLIVSTPTGSTAYALASGGPILHPTVPAIALVPICPQTMTARPIAVNDAATVEFMLTRGVDAKVHFDGHSHFDLQEMDRVSIKRYRNSLRILHPLGYNYYDMLRHKLHWGERLF